MFGDSVFDEEDDRSGPEREPTRPDDLFEEEDDQVMAFGGLDERLRRREAVAQLLREVGGC